MPAQRSPVVVPSGTARIALLPGEVVAVAMSAAATGGELLMLDYRVDPGAGPPLHRHQHEDETFLVLEGEVTFVVDGVRHTAGAGASVHAPRGTTHTFRNLGDRRARMVVVVTPGANFERFYDAFVEVLGRAGSMESKGPVLGAIGAAHGVEIVGPNPL